MAYALVGSLLANRDRYPTVPPEFAQHVGWVCLAFCVIVAFYAWTRAESLRRSVLGLTDPRVYAVLRIGFAILTIVCFLNLFPYWRMLWSDEGIFNLAYAQDRLGRTAMRGWTPDEGFFDGWAVLNFLWEKPSLFYIYGSPDFVVWYMVAFFGVLTLYCFGVASRVTGVLSWLMMSMVYNRNALYWEGTDTVYRCFWFLLLFCKTGHAWSFDNWWRCRRLKKKGVLDKYPIYRLVPAWPRYVMYLQLAALYCTTGAVKTGSVWLKGDAFYYALNMDHFYRFEYATQWVSSVLGTNLFRVMTWVTHWWERTFPFLLLGIALQFGLKHKHEPWYKRMHSGWRKWVGRLALVAAWGLCYRIVFMALPFCLAMQGDNPQDSAPALFKVHMVFGVAVPICVAVWFVLGWKPVSLFKGGRAIPKVTKWRKWLRIPEIRIEQGSLRRWFLGRRLWLGLGLMFHGGLIAFMNIGVFEMIMLMTFPAFIDGDEYARAFKWCAKKLRARKRLAFLAPKKLDDYLIDAEDPRNVKVRGRRIPDAIVLVLGLAGLFLIYEKIEKTDWVKTATYWWLGTIVVTSLLFRFLRPRPMDIARAREAGPAPAYGALGRALAMFAILYHSSAVGLGLFPSYPIFSKWRSPARSIFGGWQKGTGTTQSWRMFAPNPPRSNAFMKTVVVLENGDRWDLRSNTFHYYEDGPLGSRPNPWIINDRMRKMQRRMVGKGKWYLRYWSAYHCREWELEHGEQPVRIEIKKYLTHIPKPEVVNFWQPSRFKGRRDPRSGAITGVPYNPRKIKVIEVDVQKHKCSGEGDIPLYMKERYGLPISDEDREKSARDEAKRESKYNGRPGSWEKRRDWGKWFEGDDRQVSRKKQADLRRQRAKEAREAREKEAAKHPEGGEDDGQDE